MTKLTHGFKVLAFAYSESAPRCLRNFPLLNYYLAVVYQLFGLSECSAITAAFSRLEMLKRSKSPDHTQTQQKVTDE